MGRFQIDWSSDFMVKRFLPAGHANAPFVAGLQAGKFPLGPRRHEIVTLQHGEIEKLTCHFRANGVQPDIAGTGLAETVTIKSRQRVTAAALQFCSEHIGRHAGHNKRDSAILHGTAAR